MENSIQFFERTAEKQQGFIRYHSGRNVTEFSEVYMMAAYAWGTANSGTDVLDVCIGTGAASQLLLDRKYDIYGVDGSPKMLELAAKNGFDLQKLSLADITSTKLPYEDASFSIVLTAASLFYLKNATDVVAEMFRVAKPGGLVLMDPLIHKNKKRGVIEHMNKGDLATVPPAYIQSAEEFDKACRRAGGTMRQTLHTSPHVINSLVSPLPLKQPVFAFIKR